MNNGILARNDFHAQVMLHLLVIDTYYMSVAHGYIHGFAQLCIV